MVQDQNFINQIRLYLDKKLFDNLKFTLNSETNFSHLSNKDFYVICYAYHVIQDYQKSNELITKRINKLDDFNLKKNFLRLEIFNHFKLKNQADLKSLILSSLQLGLDVEVIKVFYLSIKNITDYDLFLKTTSRLIRKNYINSKDCLSLLIFFQQHQETFIQTLILQKLIKLHPDDKKILNNLGVSFFQLKKYHLAKKYFEKLLKLNQLNEVLLSLISINNILRNQDKAEEYLKMLLKNNPFDYQGLYQEQELNFYKEDNDTLISKYETILKNKANPSQDNYYLILAVSKLYEKNQNYKKSFEYIEKFNHIKNKSIQFDISNVQKESDFFLKNFSNKNFVLDIEKKNLTKSKKTPIFILGLPRSGTTLIEHILGAHSLVQHFGERNFFFKNFKFLFDVYNLDRNEKILGNLSPNHFLEYGNFYKEYFKLYSGKKYFTDKMPFNFLYIGLIKYTLPDAKIILCKRDYRDVGLSIYKNFFAEDIKFAYDKKFIIQYIKLFDETMREWIKVFDKRIFQINYDNLALDPKKYIKELLEYCELPWENSCIEFQKKKLLADTVSLHQVSNPIYDKSIGNWKNYYEFSEDFFNALELKK